MYFVYKGIHVRATCFDLIGHPQALPEHIFKRCSVSVHCGISQCKKKTEQRLNMCFGRAWGWPIRSKHVALTCIPLYTK